MHPLDSLEDGYEQLRDLVISYLGLEDARIDAPRPNTSDEIKRLDDYDIQRSGTIEIHHANCHSLSLGHDIDSFLPSTNATGCRNSSHPSADSPMNTGINQNIRFKFGGSAPPTMMSSEYAVRQSAKARMRDLFELKTANIESQLRRHMSKTVPPLASKIDRASGRCGTRSAPIRDPSSDLLNYTPDSSMDPHDLQGDMDDNVSIRSEV